MTAHAVAMLTRPSVTIASLVLLSVILSSAVLVPQAAAVLKIPSIKLWPMWHDQWSHHLAKQIGLAPSPKSQTTAGFAKEAPTVKLCSCDAFSCHTWGACPRCSSQGAAQWSQMAAMVQPPMWLHVAALGQPYGSHAVKPAAATAAAVCHTCDSQCGRKGSVMWHHVAAMGQPCGTAI